MTNPIAAMGITPAIKTISPWPKPARKPREDSMASRERPNTESGFLLISRELPGW
ncbi:hypothetical protein D3C76_1209840 [compost metagenome]